jgi:hypothetical protein
VTEALPRQPLIYTRFDLNVERFLEAWKPVDAIREIIANALDETVLSGEFLFQYLEEKVPKVLAIIIFSYNPVRKVTFESEGTSWFISDPGRGLRSEHLTQNESIEKRIQPKDSVIIGTFGVGLKDAFSTLHRHHIPVTVHSCAHTLTFGMFPKHGTNRFSLHTHTQESKLTAHIITFDTFHA